MSCKLGRLGRGLVQGGGRETLVGARLPAKCTASSCELPEPLKTTALGVPEPLRMADRADQLETGSLETFPVCQALRGCHFCLGLSQLDIASI